MTRCTRALDLVVPFVAVLIVLHLFLRNGYGSLAPLSFFTPVPLIVLAVIEFALIRRVRGAIGHDPDTKPMMAIAIARCAALGKASAIASAAVAGAAAAMLIRVLPIFSTVDAARHDTEVSVVVLGASVLLTTVGLLLERAALIPTDPQK